VSIANVSMHIDSQPSVPPQKSGYQFGLKYLFVPPLLVAFYFAMAACLGFDAASALTFVVLLFIGLFVSRTRAIQIVSLIALIGLVFYLLLPDIGSHAPGRRAQCMNNLRDVALALQNYHSTYGCFPPAYVTDAQGNRMHSWRVLILPFLDEDALYKQYRLNEPWNGPNNSKLAKLMPRIYRCPNSPQGVAMTDYVAVVGSRTAWPGSKSRRLSEITDGASVTLLVVESSNSGINWMEPRDLDFDQMSMTVNSASGVGISGQHPKSSRFPRQEPTGACAAMADGSVHFLPNDLSSETLKALLTVDGDETANIDW